MRHFRSFLPDLLFLFLAIPPCHERGMSPQKRNRRNKMEQNRKQKALGSQNGQRVLPPDPEEMNDARSDWAAAAIDAFRDETGTDLEDAVSDLLADLMHWCGRNGQSF